MKAVSDWFRRAGGSCLRWFCGAGGLLLPASLLAHDCGPPQITLRAGESCSWIISADRQEVSSHYVPNQTGTPGVAFVTPSEKFDAKHGVFLITGQAPGTNTLTVNWNYPGTGAAGICTVQIIVLPADPNANFQTLLQEGALCTWRHTVISAQQVRELLDESIPAEAQKLLIFTQCYGGSMALSEKFRDRPNTTVLSATSPNQTAKFGGYDDDAARALQPGDGRTARDVHQAGSAGKCTLAPVHGGPPHAKTNDFAAGEWPRVAGALAATDFSLAHVTANGVVRSRHIVVYAGAPDVKAIRSSVHAGVTIPDAGGNATNNVSDAAYRDTIKQNFAADPNTTVHSAGGARQTPGSALGKNGWDYSGDIDGLAAALEAAGQAIRSSPNPAAEQFILYVTDHGARGFNAPVAGPATLPPMAASAAVTGLRVQDPALTQGIDQIRADPENRCGFFLQLVGGGGAFAPQNFGPQTLPQFAPGDLALEIQTAGAAPLRFTEFVAEPFDLDRDGTIGSVPGESINIFFPVARAQFVSLLQGPAMDVLIDNQTATAWQMTDFVLSTGPVAKSALPVPLPEVLSFRQINATTVELTARGVAQLQYAVEISSDLVTWQRGPLVTFFTDVQKLQVGGGGAGKFYRLVWVSP